MSLSQFQRALACVLVLICAVEVALIEGFAGASLPMSVKATGRHQSKLMMYVPRHSSAPLSPEDDGLQMIPNPTSIGPSIREQQYKKTKQENTQRRYTTELSNSVLHECNTLPSFPTAHGILSPETVMRMEEMVEFDGHTSEAVDGFLKQYRSNGPMSCLSMLSDPEVLPHLTRAMRDVV